MTNKQNAAQIEIEIAEFVARANACMAAAKAIPPSDCETPEQYAAEVCREALVAEYTKWMKFAEEGRAMLAPVVDGD